MVLVRRIHKRNANIVVEAHAEVLFAPTGDLGVWQRRFSARVRAFSAEAAPTNKRPRWGHYGKPLKSTFTASTTYQPGRMKVYSAIGSSAPHAYYVDQGTGVFAGNGPYEAAVLPPWTRGSPSLYERTWRPGGPQGKRVKPVMIQGQIGKHFLDKGLKRGFQSMRMRSFQVPDDGLIGKAMGGFPTGLENFVGNTPSNKAFEASLRQWRLWRDETLAFGGALGKEGSISYQSKKSKAKKAKAQNQSAPVKPTRPPKPTGPTKAQIAAALLKAIKKERADLLAQASEKYPGRRVTVGGRRLHNGQYAYEITVVYKDGRVFHLWAPSEYQAGL